jgi:hypothetical protein
VKEFRFIGQAADQLDNGRPVEPGDYTGPINAKAPQNARLIREGQLLEVPDGTAEAHLAGDTERVSELTAHIRNLGEDTEPESETNDSEEGDNL